MTVFALVAYGVGGYLFLVEAVELTYPFLDMERDPVLNFLIALIGVGMFVTSLPLLMLAPLFNQNGVDVAQTLLGALGLALVQVSVFKLA